MLHPSSVHAAFTLNVSLFCKLCSEWRLTGHGKEAALETADNTRMSKVIWLRLDNFMILVRSVPEGFIERLHILVSIKRTILEIQQLQMKGI